jgi:hypothetical protein
LTTNAFWQQGEVQAGRALARHHDGSTDWNQTLLVPPDVLEVRLRLGFIRADNHGRWQFEVLDPRGRELLAMYSRPHFPLDELEETLAEVGRRLGLLLEAYLDPDPFP